LRAAEDFSRHIDYVHFNPAKHGVAVSAGDWPYSSFRQALTRGRYLSGWVHGGEDAGDFGVRETTGDSS
jgi:putative transposase